MRSTVLSVLFNSLCVLSILPPNDIAWLGDAPYMVYVRIPPRSLCSGVILNKEIIVTAAHCLYKIREEQNVYIEAATRRGLQNNSNKQIRRSKDILVHEDFMFSNTQFNETLTSQETFNDICLIQLDIALEFNEFVAPIDWIKNNNSIDYSTIATFNGYAYTYKRYHPASILRSKNISLIPEDECQTLLMPTVFRKQNYDICTRPGPCAGDSGGPLVQEINGTTKLIGILSWTADKNRTCGKGPAIYVNIGYFSEWIQEAIEYLMNV